MKPHTGVADRVSKPHKEVQEEQPSLLDAFAVTAPGLASLVAAEFAALGLTPREVSDAGVAFDATLADVLRVNLWSRMTSRVLVRLAVFEARDFATLEKQATKMAWSRVFERGMTARLRVTCRKSRLYLSDAVAERIVKQIGKHFGVDAPVVRLTDSDDEVVIERQVVEPCLEHAVL